MEANVSCIEARLKSILADIEEQNEIINLLENRLSIVLRSVSVDSNVEDNILPIEQSAAQLEHALYMINDTLVCNTNKLTKLMSCLAV